MPRRTHWIGCGGSLRACLCICISMEKARKSWMLFHILPFPSFGASASAPGGGGLWWCNFLQKSKSMRKRNGLLWTLHKRARSLTGQLKSTSHSILSQTEAKPQIH